MSSLSAALKKVRSILKPKSKMNLVEWADEYRFLSPESSAEPGRFKTSRVEVGRGPMMALTNPKVKKITVQACTQLLKTELINNIVAYHIHQDPCPIIVMQPTISLAEVWGEDRLQNMIRDTPVLKELVVGKKSRDSGNTKDKKNFPGGYVAMIGANSPTELASRPVRIVLCDEVDKYPRSAGKEGDPIKLISERSATFWNSKVIHVCSPTIEGDSRINEEYKLSNQGIYKVPCPHCSENTEMKWEHIKWEEGKPETAQYYCVECGEAWTEPQRIKAIAKGDFYFLKPEVTDHYGFKVSKLSSPWETIPTLAKKFEEAKDSTEKMKTFRNTQIAETFKDSGEAPEWQRIYRAREEYKIGIVPLPVVCLTIGADIQKDRIELEVVGFCRNMETYSINYIVLDGDTEKDEVWNKLENEILKMYEHENGKTLPIRMAAIDSGYRSSKVYEFVSRFSLGKVYAVKGSDNLKTAIGSVSDVTVKRDGKKLRRGLRLWNVGVSFLKDELYGQLSKEQPLDKDSPFPKGYCHFPEYDKTYFKMLTAEEKRENKNKNGHSLFEWYKIRERNEALDCRVYNLFCSYVLRLRDFKEINWQQLESEMGNEPHISLKDSDNIQKKTKKRRSRDSSIW